ncbi:MAG TPA: dynamin family protein [Bacilli bacterium]
MKVTTLRELATSMQMRGDFSNASQMFRLADKLEKSQLSISFCGHFSAGKSTLINRLCGADLLPSGPIPTSANVVWIMNGATGAVIYRKHECADEGKRQNGESISLDQLAESCKNGETIESIEIKSPIPWLGEHAALMDTPGIDSTDERHLRATLATLSLTDCIFYVMDYNHVQSDTNFIFIKQLMEWNKPLYLIVNQIDKHKPGELSFAEYRAAVERAFRDWQIKPAGILYLSLKDPDHPENEWQKLGWLLEQFVAERGELLPASVGASAKRLVELHGEYIAGLQEAEKAMLAEKIGLNCAPQEAIARIAADLADLRRGLEACSRRKETALQEYQSELRRTIENANIMPATLRNLAEQYLQGISPSFKVGWLMAKNKTRKETERRTDVFLTHLQKQTDMELSRHVAALLRKFAVDNGIEDAELAEQINQFSVSITAEWLRAQVQSGAVASREYVLNFSRQVAEEIRLIARKKAQAISAGLQNAYLAQIESEMAEVERNIQRLEERDVAAHKLLALAQDAERYVLGLQEKLASAATVPTPNLPDLSDASTQYENSGMWRELLRKGATAKSGELAAVVAVDAAAQASGADKRNAWDEVKRNASSVSAPRIKTDPGDLQRSKKAAAQIRNAVQILDTVPHMGSFSRALAEKAKRMEQRTFTAALFGAFSAGKSSFANALIGQAVLPVSPNPTTAALCKMLPATAEFPHGTAKIKKKSKESMLDDIRFSLAALGIVIADKERPWETIRSLDFASITAKGKPHAAFLQAALRGWSEAEQEWSRELVVDLPQFRAYAADEQKSCFVEWIELYLESPLMDAGIALVDTPGADSIHARHTGVAFEYIKNADVIIYVTYYNHAFSKADQYFLEQLGSVKESFQLDKMFFVVNAADLAADSAELQHVLEHVRDRLTAHGIRHARLFPVSSSYGLQGKMTDERTILQASNLPAFEQAFLGFCREELTDLALSAAQADLAKATSTLERRIAAAEKGLNEQERRGLKLREALDEVKIWLSGQTYEQKISELAQEIETLLHYIIQRIRYRFGEFYNEAFHPAQLSGSVDKRTALRAAWNELVRTLTQEIERELLTASLRVETFAERLCATQYAAAAEHISASLKDFTAAEFSPAAWPTPDISVQLPVEMDERMLLRHFKHARAFFEEGGKAALREPLEAELMDAVAQAVQAYAVRFKQLYGKQLQDRFAAVSRELATAADEHTAGILAAGDSPETLANWKEKARQLTLCMQHIHAI